MNDDAHELLSLGTKTAPWMIKGFSVALREQITDTARRQGATTADWLHAYFQKHGIDGQQFDPVKIDRVGPSPQSTVEDLCRLTEAAAKLAEHREQMPRGLRAALTRRLQEALGAPAPRRLRLAAPARQTEESLTEENAA
jgi:hypothetical protein